MLLKKKKVDEEEEKKIEGGDDDGPKVSTKTVKKQSMEELRVRTGKKIK